MSQTFQITWVGDRTRDWETDKGQFTAYKIALAGYDPSENDPEAGKTVEWSRRRDAQAPAPGDEVFGHIEVKTYDWGNKYVFKTDQAEQGRPPSFKKASNGVVPAVTQDDRSRRIERQHSQEMAIRATALLGDLPPEMGQEDLRNTIKNWTDWFVADLEAPKAALQKAVGASTTAETKPAYSGPGPEGVGEPEPKHRVEVVRDATNKVKTSAPSGLSDDSEIPF
jgi:hypothetical protein